jgi:uncharacterized membrane protein
MGLVLSVAACGGDDDDDGIVTPTPSIAVSAGTATVNVTAGQSGTSAITITRNGGYTGAVNLAVTGAPAGVTATFNPTSVASGATTSTLTLATTGATAAGTYPLVVTASGTGVANATTPISLVVTAAPASGFTIAPAAAVTVTQGAAAQNATINITRAGGFAGAVTLTTSGTIPAGLTVTPGAASTGNTATVAISANTTVAPGTYPITINATGAGVTGTQTTTLNVTVAAAQATQDFTITPAAVSVAAGTSGTSAVTITRTGGFTGAVTLTTSGAPTGLTVTAPAATTENTATLTIAAASNLAPGTYPVTVSATGAGVTGTKTATLNVTVTPAVTVGNFTLGTSGNVTVQQGQSATTTLNVTRTGGFAGGVQVTQSGAPNGVTVTVNPNPVTANTATVTVAAANNATTGTATVTLTGASTGLANQTTTFTVNVTAASTGGGGNVSYAFCSPDVPIWFAFQNDNGAWTRVTAGANNTFAFNVPTRGGIAYVTQSGTNYDLTVVYGTAAELIAGGQNRCVAPRAGTKRLTGTVSGVGLTDFASVSLGLSSELLVGGQTSFTLDSVPEGPLNLLASRSSIDLNTFSLIPSRLILRRNVNYANGAAIPALDFNSSEAFAPATANLTINGAGTDTAFVVTSFFTGSFALNGFSTGGAFLNFGSSPLRYAGLPADRLQAGDMHAVIAFANVRGDSTSTRGVLSFVRTIVDRSVTLGPVPSAANVTAISSTPYLRLRATAPSQAAYNAGASVSFTQATRSATVSVTPGYAGSAPATWDLSMPDLSSAGFDATWGLRPATRTDWGLSTFGGNFIAFLGGTPTEGTTLQIANKTGVFAGTARSFSRQSASSGQSAMGVTAQRAMDRAARLQRVIVSRAQRR